MTDKPRPLSLAMEAKTTIYFSRKSTVSFIRGKNLVLVPDAQGEAEIPLGRVRRAVVIGKAAPDSRVLYRLSRCGIPIDWLDILGKPIAQTLPLDEDPDLLFPDQTALPGTPAALELTRSFLLAKLDNCREVIRRRVKMNSSWRERRLAVERAASAGELRGAEGMAAREYFSYWPLLLNKFEWKGRYPHPAPDPVNMLLSLGYGLLRNRLSSALRGAGLDPRIGFFHERRGRHCALASDLMEPFRAFVDAAVLDLIRLNEVKPEEFKIRNAQCVCADNSLFPKLLAAFEDMFAKVHAFYPCAAAGRRKLCVNDCLDELAQSFNRYLSANEQCFLPRLTPCRAS